MKKDKDTRILQIIPCTRSMNALYRNDENHDKIMKIPVLGFALCADDDGCTFVTPLEFDGESGVAELGTFIMNFDEGVYSPCGYELKDMKGEEDNADTCE